MSLYKYLGTYGQYLVGNNIADTRAHAIEKGMREVLSAVNGCDDRNLALFKKHEPDLYKGIVRYATIQMERVPE